MIGIILVDVHVITLGLDDGTELGSLDRSFDGSNDGKLDTVFLVDSMGYTDGKMIGSDEGIKLGISELGSLDRSFDGSNDGNLGGLLLGDSVGYTYGKMLGSDEGIKLGISDSEVLGTILLNVDEITLGHDVGTELVSLDGSFDGYNDGKLETVFL